MSNTINQSLAADTAPNGHDADDLGPEGVPLGGAGDASRLPSIAVDLAAWGRGQAEYPLVEVKLAIDEYILREIYKIVDSRFVSLNSRADAVRFLIDEGFISSAEARTDV
jgi:hypothetical protein